MPQVHNALSRSQLGPALKDILGDSKSEGALERFGETLTPTLDMWALAEWAYLRGEHLWACTVVRVADAANFGLVAVMLPNASRFLVTVDRVGGRNSVIAGNLVISQTSRDNVAAMAGFALGNPPQFRDQRAHATVGAFMAPVETASALTGAVLFNGTVENLAFPAADNREFISPPYVIRPGGALIVQSAAVNQQIVVTFVGRVRAALPTELKS